MSASFNFLLCNLFSVNGNKLLKFFLYCLFRVNLVSFWKGIVLFRMNKVRFLVFKKSSVTAKKSIYCLSNTHSNCGGSLH